MENGILKTLLTSRNPVAKLCYSRCGTTLAVWSRRSPLLEDVTVHKTRGELPTLAVLAHLYFDKGTD